MFEGSKSRDNEINWSYNFIYNNINMLFIEIMTSMYRAKINRIRGREKQNVVE